MSSSVALHGVTVSYGTRAERVTALDDIDVSIEAGEYVTVIGSNGAGKSTLVNVIAGAVMPSAGQVKIGSADVTRLPDNRRAGRVSRVFQDVTAGTCADLTIAENMALASLRERGRSPFRRILSRRRTAEFHSELRHLGCGLEDRLMRPAGLLSGGQRQLVSLVMATMGDPAVLLLDEHTSALDPSMAELVMNRTDTVVRERGLTAVMVTHNMRHAALYGDRVLIMTQGRIVDDISGRERTALTEDKLIARFRDLAGGEITDRIIGV